MRVLVTGGAGFIGSHLVDALIDRGEDVTVLDSLVPQVHKDIPDYLNEKAELIRDSVANKDLLLELLQNNDVLFHQAAAVGVGQSMYQIEKYMQENTQNTAILLELLANKEHSIKKLIVASSMSIYGEGKYECPDCGVIYPKLRPEEQLLRKEWEVRCTCGKEARPLPTDESKPLYPTSIYAIGKKNQEEMSLVIGQAYGIPTVALRYFNVYGTRQALSNPYTGVCAIFSSRIMNNRSPTIFEDGNQSRDFIHVSDIVKANLLALDKNKANYEAFNVGTGVPITINKIAEILLNHYKKELKPQYPNKFRKGDIRHCFADISKISKLGFKPKISFQEGVPELVEWVKKQSCEDKFDDAQKELEEKGLAV